MRCFTRTLILLSLLTIRSVAALLMSDLPTPSLVLDMQVLQKHVDTIAGEKSSRIPPLSFANHVLRPCDASETQTVDQKAPPIRIRDLQADQAICYLHSRVVRSRQEAVKGQDDPVSTFLAEIDLRPSACGSAGAELVLGLNNHHVGSYYWARSTGSGASMEAPGVLFDMNNDAQGVLRWEKEGGPTECNSNDGKRSEWVNFLRAGDTVQLLPFDVDDAVSCMLSSGGESDRIFGVSSKNRPLGSEPEVVCEWRIQ
jgi:hypothetical protein